MMTETEIEQAAVDALSPETALVVKIEAMGLEVKTLAIVDQKSFDEVAAFGRKVAGMRKEVDAYYKPLKQEQDRLKGFILDREKAALARLFAPEQAAKKLIDDYVTAKRKEQAELDRLERVRAEEAHEAERQQKIQEARDNATRQVAESMQAATPQEEKVLVKHADSIIDNAGREAARSMPTQVTHRVEEVLRPAPGTSTGIKYSVKVDDAMKIVKAVADGTLPLAYIIINEAALNSKARLEKDGFDVDGCSLMKNGTVTFRQKRAQ